MYPDISLCLTPPSGSQILKTGGSDNSLTKNLQILSHLPLITAKIHYLFRACGAFCPYKMRFWAKFLDLAKIWLIFQRFALDNSKVTHFFEPAACIALRKCDFWPNSWISGIWSSRALENEGGQTITIGGGGRGLTKWNILIFLQK